MLVRHSFGSLVTCIQVSLSRAGLGYVLEEGGIKDGLNQGREPVASGSQVPHPSAELRGWEHKSDSPVEGRRLRSGDPRVQDLKIGRLGWSRRL